MRERSRAPAIVDGGDLADVEPSQAVVDEALVTIWHAEITLPGHGSAATLLAGLLGAHGHAQR